MIIDMHTHLSDIRIYPEYWIENVKHSIKKKLEKDISARASDDLIHNYVKNALNDLNGDKKIKLMDECRVNKAVLLQTDFGYGREEDEKIYRIVEIHRVILEKYPDRLIGFAGIDPRRGKTGIDLFERCIREYNFRGLKLYPPCGYEIDDRELYAFYEICNHYRLPVLIHIGPSWEDMKSSFRYPESVLKVSKEFANIPFILGHAALLFYEQSFQLPLERENIYLEVSGYQKIKNQKVLAKRMRSLLTDCPNQLLFGSDWPMYSLLKQDISFFESLDFMTVSQKEKFFYKNALTVLGMQNVNE